MRKVMLTQNQILVMIYLVNLKKGYGKPGFDDMLKISEIVTPDLIVYPKSASVSKYQNTVYKITYSH